MKPELRDYAPAGSAAGLALEAVDLERLPRHVAVIMDGNGRWAAARRRPRGFGHRRGTEAVREVVEASARLGLEALTLYAFSRQNWKRPAHEVAALMALTREYVRRETAYLVENGIRFRVIGRPGDLPEAVREDLVRAEDATAAGTGTRFNVALSYGSRTEILDAVAALARDGFTGERASGIREADLAARLSTAGLPEPELLIRTSGECRLSNFLLWEAARAELHVTPTLWPDFRREDLFAAVAEFQARRREPS